MAPPTKKAKVDTSKHDILSFFGSAQSRGATSSSKSEAKPEAKPPKEVLLTPKETKTKIKAKTRVESEDSEDGEAKPKPKFKCATF